MCECQELIAGYLYDELSPPERLEFEAHLRGCAECRGDVDGLRATRVHLASWSPPEPDLGFRVIRGGAAPAAALPRPRRLAPAFGFAAAAVIVLAAALAIANVEVRYGGDGVTVRTGWAESPVTPAPATNPAPAAVPAAAAEFAALDRRLRELETAMTTTGAGTMSAADAGGLSDTEILRRVRQIVTEAEARQETAFARRLLEVVRDFDRQRRADILLIQQGLGQYQGLTNAEIAQNRDMLNQLVRAAATRQEK